jgi:F5/8 type C domain-containing protein/type IX secretion system substrate protein/fibronectin type III domain protein
MKTFTIYCAICIIMILQCFVAFSQVSVLTQHNDLARTGWNNQETILNPTNVNSNSFGILYSRTVDEEIYAQPLVVSGVNIPSKGTKNVVYVCTVNNTVYAFDADDGTVPPYWTINFTPSGYRVPNGTDIHPSLCFSVYWDFSTSFGIVGTPVIDKASNTMYFVTKIASNTGIDNHTYNTHIPDDEYNYSSSGFYQYLHAIDLSTGAEKTNSPVQIMATAPGTGDGNVGGVISFDPRRQFNRAGLVLSGGIVYIPYAAHCDWNPCHGWVLGYDASSLQQKIVYITTPNDGRGGIWMSGGAPAVDASGSLYFTTGNAYDGGTFTDLPSATANRGESVVKITPNATDNTATAVSISSYFTPYNYAYLNGADLDFPIQTMLIPNTNMVLTGCKDNNLYVMDRTNMGLFNSTSNNVLQTISVGSNAQMHSNLAYFGGATNQYVYQLSENTLLQAFKVQANSLGTAITGNISGPTGASGGFMSVSSNGSDPTTGILWVSQAVNGCNANGTLCQGILRAIKADDVTTELWNSTINTVDNTGYFAKMTCPTIANGKVYLNSFSKQLNVYGLLASNPRCITNVALNKTAYASTQGTYAHFSFDGNLTTNWSSNATNNEYLYVDLGQEYSICRVVINWSVAYGKDFNIDVSDDASTWTTVQQVRGNTSYLTEFDGNVTGRYVRMAGITSGTNSGYSINEMQVLGQLLNTCTAPTGLAASNITQNTATLSWQSVTGANSYVIQYKTPLVSSWVTRTSTTNSISISALTCGTGYNYQVQAVCASGQSAFSSGAFNTSTCTATCGALLTRYFAADIGDIGVAGSSCLSSGIYTLKGSGTDIGGTSDAFQFAFNNLNGDQEISAQVLTQDATNAANKAGLMIRDSVSNTSRFAFIALTSSNGAIFEYRNSPGGAATIVTVPGIKAPYWLKLDKSGTKYSAYISATGATNSWTQVGSTTDVGFGGSAPVYIGMAVTSANNTVLSTATIGSYLDNNSPLPLNLISFTANNVNNEYVQLNWATSSESNTDYFEVQRSGDGTSFAKVAQVKAAGNSNANHYYSQQDPNAGRGLNLYRLKEFDIDGNISYSPVVAVNFGRNVLPEISPNPASAYFTVLAGIEPIKEITVFDASGKTIQHIVNESASSAITIASGNLAAGIYIVKIKTDKQIYQQKLFKQ